MSQIDPVPVSMQADNGASKMPTIPSSFLRVGQMATIDKISGSEEVRKFLAGLGFVRGTPIKAVSNNNTGLIFEVKGSRVAVDLKMATKIHVASES